jgi:hypothetical protein
VLRERGGAILNVTSDAAVEPYAGWGDATANRSAASFGHGREAAEKIVPGLGAELGSPVAVGHGLSVSARMPLTMRRRP